MLLVVDFSDLGLECTQTDIRLDPGADFTVGKLIMKLCAGIEELGKTEVPDKGNMLLLDPQSRVLEATVKMDALTLSDWDTIYLTRRR